MIEKLVHNNLNDQLQENYTKHHVNCHNRPGPLLTKISKKRDHAAPSIQGNVRMMKTLSTLKSSTLKR